MAPQVLVVQCEADAPAAWLGEWLVEAGCTLDVRHPYAGESLPPDLDGHDLLLVLGGEAGANDDHVAWIPETKALVRDADARGVPTLGVCLGHQLCAVALGGEVGRNPRGQQLGLVPTGWLPAASDDPLTAGLTGARRGVHWNDDLVLRLPDGATLLAETPAGEPQVVRLARTVWGVQLHPEVDEQVVAAWAVGARDGRADAVVAEVAAAREELVSAWRPLATAFVSTLERSPR